MFQTRRHRFDESIPPDAADGGPYARVRVLDISLERHAGGNLLFLPILEELRGCRDESFPDVGDQALLLLFRVGEELRVGDDRLQVPVEPTVFGNELRVERQGSRLDVQMQIGSQQRIQVHQFEIRELSVEVEARAPGERIEARTRSQPATPHRLSHQRETPCRGRRNAIRC